MSLGKKNLGALLSLALQYVHKEVTTGKDGYCLKNNKKSIMNDQLLNPLNNQHPIADCHILAAVMN